MNPELPLIAIIPAGGRSARLAPLPSSKELLPVGFMATPDGPRPKPVCLYLLERLRRGGVQRAFIVLRPGKWDIAAYLGHGAQLGLDLAYLIMNLPHGSPYSLDQAYPFARDCMVALGFPDIIFEPADAFAQLRERQRASGAAVVLGLFPTDQPQAVDMVATTPDGRAVQIEIKPTQTTLRFTWMIALWTPAFTEFLHAHLAEIEQRRADPDPTLGPQREVFVGDVIQAAITRGMFVDTLSFPEGSALDVGSPESLVRAVRHFGALPPGE